MPRGGHLQLCKTPIATTYCALREQSVYIGDVVPTATTYLVHRGRLKIRHCIEKQLMVGMHTRSLETHPTSIKVNIYIRRVNLRYELALDVILNPPRITITGIIVPIKVIIIESAFLVKQTFKH